MRALLIDDERLARLELRRLLSAHPTVEIVGEARDADEAEALITELNPDLIFLDIQMPGRTGFDLLADLDRPPAVIFTTAYDEFALRAFEVSALDYLLKPVAPERLAAAIEKAIEKVSEKATAARTTTAASPAPSQIFVKDGDHCWFVATESIELLESEGNYTRLYFMQSGERHRPLVLRSLNYLEERLDPSVFFRASRKHIVGLKWITRIDPSVSGGLELQMKGGQTVEMSRRQAARFKEVMSL
ncbi:MAG: LytTR family DNA-binding domain-containing protein [Acidobacteria bacterium]|nr:LytTR family DNA-binding domain-containing protein [Acidobacteriota bacterium]